MSKPLFNINAMNELGKRIAKEHKEHQSVMWPDKADKRGANGLRYKTRKTGDEAIYVRNALNQKGYTTKVERRSETKWRVYYW